MKQGRCSRSMCRGLFCIFIWVAAVIVVQVSHWPPSIDPERQAVDMIWVCGGFIAQAVGVIVWASTLRRSEKQTPPR